MRDTANHPWMALSLEGGGFHLLDGDEASITHCVWERWLDLSDREVREALGLVDEERYLELFKRYVVHASHHVKRERLLDAVTGKEVDPDKKFMKELETTMDPNAGEKFREDVLARIGAWALSHPNEDPAYEEIFADYFARLREDYYRQQKERVSHSIQRMLELLSDEKEGDSELSLSAEEEDRAREALDRLLEGTVTGAPRERHNRETLQDTLVHLSRTRYAL
jgi:predicted Ser/Thr protein kinase